MKIHILADNRTKKRGYLAEHGLSVLIEHGEKKILFDTGQSDVYVRNARRMGLSLGDADAVILSHGHYDHAGGLESFPAADRYPRVYVHEDPFFGKPIAGTIPDSYGGIGVPWSPSFFERIRDHLDFGAGKREIAPNVALIDTIPTTAEYEIRPLPAGARITDDLPADGMFDEQVLVIRTGVGLLVFIGCSHPGVVSCLDHVLRQYPDERIYALVAGMNLESASPLRLQRTIEAVSEMNIQIIIPLHCTGLTAISEMKKQLGGKCVELGAGETYEIYA